MRVLCGWELGAGFGHVGRLRPIIERLRAQGAEIILALQEVEQAAAFADPDGVLPPDITTVPVPRWDMPGDPDSRRAPTESFADVLTLVGFSQPNLLATRLDAWRGLVTLAKPDLVIGDFAPCLRLAARGRAPMVMVGNGYTMPPGGRPLPPIRPWQEALQPFSLENERRLLAMVNGVLIQRGDPPLEFLGDILCGDASFVFSIPMVDPYAAHRTEPTLPPVNMPTGIHPIPWHQRPERSVFFYMPGRHPRVVEAMEAVKAAGVRAKAHIGNLTERGRDVHRAPDFQISLAPLPFDKVLPEARAVVHHAGLSTAVAAVMAGTPQLLLPWNLEHVVTARALEKLGVAVTVGGGPEWDQRQITRAVATMVGDSDLAAKAAVAAGQLKIGDPEAGLNRVIERCLQLARSGV